MASNLRLIVLWLMCLVACVSSSSALASKERPFVTGGAMWSSDVRIGVSAGNVLLVPFVVPGPGAVTGLSGHVLFLDHLLVAGDLGSSFGLQFSNADPAPLVGYRARLRLGLTGNPHPSLTLAADLRAGLTSFALIPLPRYGLGAALTWRPVDLEWFIWDIRGDIDAELLVIAPSPGLGLSTGTKFRFGWVEGGFRVGVEADAVVAVVINTGGVAAFLEGFIGARF